MALTQDRNTPYQDAQTIVAPVAANAVIHAGALLVANATGFAAPGSVATGLTYLGRADQAVSNAGGADGAQQVVVSRGKAFKWNNSATDPITQASLGKQCFIEDDETVAATNGTNTRSAAGIVVAIENDGIWVE